MRSFSLNSQREDGREPVAASNSSHEYYDTVGVPELFGRYTSLFRAEEAILASLREELKAKPILDIGVGAGRTTPHLRAISEHYIGIDYSEKMIDLCRKSMAGATLLVGDARNMSGFHDEQFAAVFFSYNGIDSVHPPDRIAVLGEIRRVLKRGGVFVFSSHNLDWWNGRPVASFRGVSFSANPIRFIRNNAGPLRAFATGLVDRLRNRMRSRDWAMITEYEEFMLVPVYYITEEAQREQLLGAGFRNVETVAMDGNPTNSESRVRDYLIHYVARKV